MERMMTAEADAHRGKLRCPSRGKLRCPARGRLRCPARCNLRCLARCNLRCRDASYFPKQVSRVEDRAKHQVFVPCKTRKEERHILYFPRDIMFNILLFVPVTVLHQVVRYVCKQWNDIVNDPRFVKAHCQSSSAGILLQNPITLHVYYIEGDNTTEIAFPYPARIYGSFNGLVLFHDLTNLDILSVINPVTKVKISLPPMHELDDMTSTVAFAITSYGHYKVVVSVPYEDQWRKSHVMVFTIGVDKAWRFIDNSEMEYMPRVLPLFIAGMLYWCFSDYPCFAMDVDTETIYHFPKPVDNSVLLFPRTSFLSLGVGLGFIQEDEGSGKLRLWKLTDVKSGVWIELAGINVSAVLSTVSKKLFPSKCYTNIPIMLIDDVLWIHFVVDGDLVDFVVVRYNLANQSFVLFSITNLLGFTSLPHHVHTLLSPKKFYP